MLCPSCGSKRTARSHIRRGDLKHMLLLQFPVRCHECMERLYISLPAWRKLPSSPGSKSRRTARA